MKKVLCTLVALATFFLCSSLAFADMVFVDDSFSSWDGWDTDPSISLSGSSVKVKYSASSPSVVDLVFSGEVGSAISKSFSRIKPFMFSVTVTNPDVYLMSGEVYKVSLVCNQSTFPISSNFEFFSRFTASGNVNILAEKVRVSGSSIYIDAIVTPVSSESFCTYFNFYCSGSEPSISSSDVNVSSCTLTHLVNPEPVPEPEPNPGWDLDPNKTYLPGYADSFDEWSGYDTGDPLSFGNAQFTFMGSSSGSSGSFVVKDFSNHLSGLLDTSNRPIVDGITTSYESSSLFLDSDKIYRVRGSFKMSYFSFSKLNSVSIWGGSKLAGRVWLGWRPF